MKRLTPLFALLTLLGVLGISACGPDSSNNSTFNNENNNNTSNNNNAVCNEGQRVCFNNIIQLCQDGLWVNEVSCGVGSQPPICDDNGGSPICANCVSGGTTCGDDNNVHQCTADGNVGLVTLECDSALGEQCLEANGVANCDSPCLRAASNKSYRGCDYWVVSTANGQLDPAFDNNFAVVIDNGNEAPAHVTMSGPGVNVNEEIPAHTLRVFTLPFNQDIKMAGTSSVGDPLQSGLYRASNGSGAVHVTTTLPVTVCQFNPCDYETGGTYSYSNDASLVMPSAVLSSNYIVMSRSTMSLGDGFMSELSSPGFVTIVATADNTTVQVSSSAYTAAGSGVGALTPGGQMSYQLNAGDVLQLITSQDVSTSSCPGTSSGPDDYGYYYCDPGENYDLTGTEITTNAPVAVWGGHSCDFIPYDSWACDHLEEMIFPLETWGKEFMVAQTQQVEAGHNLPALAAKLTQDRAAADLGDGLVQAQPGTHGIQWRGHGYRIPGKPVRQCAAKDHAQGLHEAQGVFIQHHRRQPGGHLHRVGDEQQYVCSHGWIEYVVAEATVHLFYQQDGKGHAQDGEPPGQQGRHRNGKQHGRQDRTQIHDYRLDLAPAQLHYHGLAGYGGGDGQHHVDQDAPAKVPDHCQATRDQGKDHPEHGLLDAVGSVCMW